MRRVRFFPYDSKAITTGGCSLPFTAESLCTSSASLGNGVSAIVAKFGFSEWVAENAELAELQTASQKVSETAEL